jgi:hypothetical protein
VFDFEKRDVFKKAKTFNSDIRKLIGTTKLDHATNDQVRSAAFMLF